MLKQLGVGAVTRQTRYKFHMIDPVTFYKDRSSSEIRMYTLHSTELQGEKLANEQHTEVENQQQQESPSTLHLNNISTKKRQTVKKIKIFCN